MPKWMRSCGRSEVAKLVVTAVAEADVAPRVGRGCGLEAGDRADGRLAGPGRRALRLLGAQKGLEILDQESALAPDADPQAGELALVGPAANRALANAEILGGFFDREQFLHLDDSGSFNWGPDWREMA